jgi:hypothetical protein
MDMTKLLKITASTALYGALFVVALNAVFQMDMQSAAYLMAMCLFTGTIHAAIWG